MMILQVTLMRQVCWSQGGLIEGRENRFVLLGKYTVFG